MGIRNSLAYDDLPGGDVFGLVLQGKYLLYGRVANVGCHWIIGRLNRLCFELA